ncbi:MAG: alginate export family protein [Bacteroidetes bacterium]|nr:alginate export family protein [Bacteroidota bacterium]
MKKTYLITALILLNILAFAQFKMEGEIRPRLEFRDGYKNLMPMDANPALLVSQRTRLGVSYQTKLYTTQITFQDVRIWGEEQINTNKVNIGLHEAWLEFNAASSIKIKIGRQVLKYDNERLIASTNWLQVGAKHDAMKVSYKSTNWDLDLIGAFNQSGDIYYQSPYLLFNKQYKNLGILWLSRKMQKFTFSNLTIVEGLRKDDVGVQINTRLTTGIISKAKLEKTDVDARFFYQTGKKQNGNKVNAYLANLDIYYHLNKESTLMAGFELQSGNRNPKIIEGSDKGFEVLYGSKHSFNGLMDYFGGSNSINGMGLFDIYLKYIAVINNKLELNFDYHYFKTPKNFQNEGVDYHGYLGSEIDLSCSIKISPEINITNIFGMMIATNSLAVAKGSDLDAVKNGYYFVTMLTFKPVFFKN